MQTPLPFLDGLRHVIRLYETSTQPICRKYGLSRVQGSILAFLYNNPQYDTARDIAQFRLLPKGNVSRAVEESIQMGLLAKTQDTSDRRCQHLHLLPPAQDIARDMIAAQHLCQEQLFCGFSDAERESYLALMQRIFQNAAAGNRGDSAAQPDCRPAD